MSASHVDLLGNLKKGQSGTIVAVKVAASGSPFRRLLEMGFIEGSVVEVVHEAPFGGDPFAVRIRGSLVALRRDEARAVEVRIHA